ncbi:MAG: PPC domain-containing DNA-binding protein [Dehalococcoidales bacterium]
MKGRNEESVYGKLGKIVTRQLPENSDLIQGIKRVCTDSGIRSGVILSAVGSVHQLSVMIPGPYQEAIHEAPGEYKILPGPMQVLSLIGFIFETEKGEMTVHIHGSFIDTQGKVHGGHVIEGENPVLARLVVVIGEVAGVSYTERFDEESNQRQFYVERI